MRKSIYYVSLLIVLIYIGSCTKEKITSRNYPRVKTLDVTEINTSGATFNANIFYNSGDQIIDHGFIWGPSEHLYLGNHYESISLSTIDGLGDFSFSSTYGLEADVKIYVRAYLRTEKNTIYGDLKSFISLGCDLPVVSDYAPKAASIWDTITITGENFSNSFDGNTVQFGTVPAYMVSSSNKEIKVLVPVELKSTNPVISIISSGNLVEVKPAFSLLIPEFIDFSPKMATIGQNVTITGKNISLSSGPPNAVWFGNSKAIIQSFSRNELIVEVPSTLTSATETLKVISFPTTREFTELFHYAPPTINYFSPTSGGPGTHVSIYGSGFHTNRDSNVVHLGGILVNLSSSNTTTLAFIIPTNIGLSTGDYKILVTTLGQTTEAPELFHFIAP